MARIRSIKPEFCQSESMGNVSRDARLLFILLWTLCDDHGRTRAPSRMLASLLYPYDSDAASLIDGWLEELEQENCIALYEVNGARYLQIINWQSHQKVDRPSKSKFPDFSESSRVLAKPREASCGDQGSRTKDQGRDQGAEEARESSRDEAAAATADDDLVPPAFLDRTPEGQAFAAWQAHAKLHGWQDPMFLNSTRRLRLRSILAICGGLNGWTCALDTAAGAEFLKTQDGQWQRWFHIDWMLDEEKFTRLMEGRYAERHRNNNDQPSSSDKFQALAELGREGTG